eukprot:m51a1_g2969 putative glycoside hydrolase (434) ;mRNA; r:698679-700346
MAAPSVVLALLFLHVLGSQGSRPNPTTPEEIVETCYSYLSSNEVTGTKDGFPFHFYQPAGTKYGPSQWLWDSGAHMISWSHRNVTNAILDMRTLLHYQLPNGRVAEITNWMSKPNQTSKKWTTEDYTDLTQTPVIAYSLRAIWDATHDAGLLREFLPPLIRFFDWWAEKRDPDGDGLVTIIHGWESGLDASPAYDLAFNVHKAKPNWLDLYPKFTSLIYQYKHKYNWDQDAILGQKKEPFELIAGYFLVQDIAVNSIYAKAAILGIMWDDSVGRFVTTFHDKMGKRAKSTVETVQSLLPLLLDSIPKKLQDSLVYGQIMNPSKFFTKYPIPSVSADSPSFEHGFPIIKALGLLWRGPTWPMMNWFVVEALVKHGYETEARQIVDRWADLYKSSGVWEHYDPLTGKAFGEEGLGMSTLIVDWLYRLGYAPKAQQ